MENNVSMIVLAIVLVLLIVILPVYNIFTRQDDMSYNVALKAVTNFADKVRTTGRLTYDDYTHLLSQLSATNNSYEIELEGHRNYYFKSKNIDNYDEEFSLETIVDYTDKILEVLKGNYDKTSDSYSYDGIYTLDRGESFFIRVKNTNITKADSLLSSIKLMDSESRVDIDYGGVVLVNSIKK